MAKVDYDDIVETFELLDDWEERYRYVIDLGKDMPAMDEALKSPLTKVDGCVSQVWIAPTMDGQGAEGRLHFTGDSDAMIVRGLIAVLHSMLSGRTAREICDKNIEGALVDLGLDQALSPQRSNGLKAMVSRLKTLAQRMADAA